MNESAMQIAEKLFVAIENGDVDAIRNIYTPDTKIWHNNDGIAQSVEQNLVTLKWVIHNIKGVKYTDVRRQPTPTGFVQQHVLRGRFKDKEIALPACIIATVEGGHITRLDEYLDSAHTAVFASR
ncbi:MAG TPA: nuclear transport factor 2 family protein [Candidatus Binataceae bacterium]|nr:nuclear transport factor 2 family protein [Candidatus Binataceae bacterium]